MNVSSPSTALPREESGCAERIGHLPPDSFAFFILDFAEPLILKSQPIWIIGRENPEPHNNVILDLSRYGDLAHGISRQHARLRYENGTYTIEDLSSTNGTWLNRSRLTPGQIYPLHNDDQIWLGPLKMLFCTGPVNTGKRVAFSLRFVNTLAAQERVMSPHVVLGEVAPYLRALEQLEEARAACLQEAPEPIFVALIEETSAQIHVQMDGLYHVAALMEKWITRWRDEHLEMVGALGAEEPPRQEQLRPLATRIGEFLQPTMPATELEPFVDAFISPLSRLITSPFEFALIA